MANYATLKAAVNQYIKTNGNKEITGAVLNSVLTAMIDSLGANYTFAGIAMPSTNPGTPDQNVFYFAMQGGTYTNFNATALPEGISLLMWNGSWTAQTIMYNDGGVFDISVYKSTGGTLATFADLSAALGTGSANIPEAARKGGMSIRFVQASDHKYVQYRLMADEFTTDTTQWAIAEEGVYVENPEFVYVKTDKDDKILWAIKADGSIYYGAGVPQQVKDYIEEKISSLSPDEYEDIVAFLSDYLGSDTTLKVMIDSINERIPDIIGSPEFLEVTTDSEDKILEGIKTDWTKVIELPLEVQGVRQETIENPEFIQVTTDFEGKIIEATRKDGKKLEYLDIEYPNGIPNQIKSNIKNSGNFVIVDKSGNGKYTTLSEAVTLEPTGSVIFVMPGVYDNEVATANLKKFYIIGTDRDSCIIKNNYGIYWRAPITMAAGCIRNLTVIQEATEKTAGDNGSYAVHADSHSMADDTFSIDNCTLINYLPGIGAIGIGLRKGPGLTIQNSRLVSVNSGRALFVHDNNNDGEAYMGEQHFRLIDCIVETGDNTTNAIEVVGCSNNNGGRTWEDTQFYVEFIRNIVRGNVEFRNFYENVTITNDDYQGVMNLRLDDTSWGNNSEVLNFDSNN